MNYAPADRARRNRMKGAAVACAKHGEGFYLVTFRWQPILSMFSLEDAEEIFSALQADRCFRAIVRVKRSPTGAFDTVIVEVGGDEHPYGFSVDLDNQTLNRWVEPPEAQALEVLYLRRA